MLDSYATTPAQITFGYEAYDALHRAVRRLNALCVSDNAFMADVK